MSSQQQQEVAAPANFHNTIKTTMRGISSKKMRGKNGAGNSTGFARKSYVKKSTILKASANQQQQQQQQVEQSSEKIKSKDVLLEKEESVIVSNSKDAGKRSADYSKEQDEQDTNESLIQEALNCISTKLQAIHPLDYSRTDNITTVFDDDDDGSLPSQETKGSSTSGSIRMPKPPPQLASLLHAATMPGVQGINACGAIKILTEKAANQVSLARTQDFVSTLVEVIKVEKSRLQSGIVTQVGTYETHNEYDTGTEATGELELSFRSYGEASERALLALKNLSCATENHESLVDIEELMECILEIVNNDQGMMRMIAFQIIANLSKSPSAKVELVKVEGLISSLVGMICSDEQYGDSDQRVSFDEAHKSALSVFIELAEYEETSRIIIEHSILVPSIIEMLRKRGFPSRAECMKIIAKTSRYGEISIHLMQNEDLLYMITKACRSRETLYRHFAVVSIMNFSSEALCREKVARAPNMLRTICFCAADPRCKEGTRECAVKCLKNLCNSPESICLFGNSSCLETLAVLACGDQGDLESGNIQFFAADALASVSHWLKVLSVVGNEKKIVSDVELEKLLKQKSLKQPRPYKLRAYQQWSS